MPLILFAVIVFLSTLVINFMISNRLNIKINMKGSDIMKIINLFILGGSLSYSGVMTH